MILEPGTLLEVAKSHMAITSDVDIVGLEEGELLWVVKMDFHSQGLALRLSNGTLVYVTSLELPFDQPTYVSPL